MTYAESFHSGGAVRWRDVADRQREIGQSLRRAYQSIVVQDIPANMLELLQQADARGRSLSVSSGASTVTIAMAVVGAFVALFLLYDVAALAMAQPGAAAFTALLASLAVIGMGTIWLIEGE